MDSHALPLTIRILVNFGLAYDVSSDGADFLLYIHPAKTAQQNVQSESLLVAQTTEQMVIHTEPMTGNRCVRLRASAGPLTLSYQASVDLKHHSADPLKLEESSVWNLPQHVLPYLFPSRYCPSDRLLKLAGREFGHIAKGYGRVEAIREWVWRRIAFTSNTSNAHTSAIDTLIEQVGVCRDFAHLMIALCRALNIPARIVTGTDYGANPVLGPPDFHAYVEAWVGDRWYIFDPSGTAVPMGLIRIATGRDAADVAFATIFGSVVTGSPLIAAEAILDVAAGIELPRHTPLALSTHNGVEFT